MHICLIIGVGRERGEEDKIGRSIGLEQPDGREGTAMLGTKRMIHEARAMLEPMTIPVDVICGRGIIDQQIIYVDGPTIQRAGLSGLSELYSHRTLDHFLANLTRGWLQSRRLRASRQCLRAEPCTRSLTRDTSKECCPTWD